jgi:HEAT repeat protein
MNKPLLLLVLGLGLAALPASAQLDLPDKPVLGGSTPDIELPKRPKGDILPRPSSRDGLDLPDGLGPKLLPIEPVPATEVPEGELLHGGPTGAIFDQLRHEKSKDEKLIAEASLSLASMGSEGLAAARLGLMEDQTNVALASARTLLLGGRPMDAMLVRSRLDVKLSSKLLIGIVEQLLSARNQADGNTLLVELIDHKRSSMRRLSARIFRDRIDESDLESLVVMAESERSDSRALALELLPRFKDPRVEQLLLNGLADKTTRVAKEASSALVEQIGGAADPLVAQLVDRSRLQGYEDRSGAFALLTLVEAEDRLGIALLPEQESTNLLMHLRGGDPFVSTVSAAALAGLGFRSVSPMQSLDLEIPHALISSVSGGVYFSEFAVVRESALRRLGQITGQYFGDDGMRWQTWWLSHAQGFRALRAVMAVEPGDHELLEVRWYAPVSGESFRLLGSLAPDFDAMYSGKTLRLVPQKSSELLKVLTTSDVFTATRLPGLIGVGTGFEREFEVRVNGQAKAFRFGVGASLEWLEPVLESLRSNRDESVWQLYPGIRFGLSAEGRKEFFQSESSFWSSPHTELERDRRLVNLMLDHVSLLDVELRDSAIAAALSIYDQPGLPSQEDFSLLIGLLRDEQFFGARARGILSLALRSGRASGLPSGESMELSSDQAGELLDVLVVGSDVMRLEPLSMVLQAATRGFQWSCAEDPRAGIRTVAAAVLANHSDQKSVDLLRRLLADPDSGVEAAAVLAVATAGKTEFAEDVSLRARIGDRFVRTAALRGLASMPTADTQDVLRMALMEQDPQLRLVAAETLAALADPRSGTLLVSMLAGGPKNPLFPAASRGLRAMGEPAWDDLLGLARSRTNSSNREAALILSAQSVVDVTSILMTLLMEDPADSQVSRELMILTCVDFSNEPDPSSAWWGWWDRTVTMEPLIWFCSALSGADLSTFGSVEKLYGPGTAEGCLGLLELIRGDSLAPFYIIERARRELGRLLGKDVGDFPPKGQLLEDWCDDLALQVSGHYARLAAESEVQVKPAVEDGESPLDLAPKTSAEAE